MPCRGVRGATTVESNSREEMLEESRKLLALMIRFNDILSEDVASALFTVTRDLNAEYPALAARQLGWIDVPLLCSYEIEVPGGLDRCIRVLLHWNTDKPQHDIVHVYIKDARKLRPDLSKIPPVDFRELEHWIEQHMAEYKETLRGRTRDAESGPATARPQGNERRGYEDAT
jgi:chorismate mutase